MPSRIGAVRFRHHADLVRNPANFRMPTNWIGCCSLPHGRGPGWPVRACRPLPCRQSQTI